MSYLDTKKVPPLKPFPFCGGEAGVWTSSNLHYQTEYHIRCKGCGAMSIGDEHYLEWAVEAWNRRVDE